MKKLWKLTEKQKETLKVIDNNKLTLAIGQGRSGKTLAIMYLLFKRAILYPGTNHAVFRNTLQSGVDGIWKITIPEVIKNFFPALPLMNGWKMNESSHEITLYNGSRITIKGLDNKDRASKILSTQWATVFIDESHLVDYEYIGLLLTRLPQPLDVKYETKIICAANWASKTSWLKLFFNDKLNPETKTPHNQKCEIITSTTYDNTSINAREYIDTLNSAGDRKSRLMCAGIGFYDEIEGSLWNQDDIKRKKALPLDEYDDIIITFDPAVTNNKSSDAHGLCVAGKINDEIHILECYEKKEDINIIAKELISLYEVYKCSRLVSETNNGGDFIPALINNHNNSVLCASVRATRGKLVRAEPVCAMYKNNKVFHTKHFIDLESQMTTYTGSSSADSPNSLDAMVWAVTYINDNSNYVDPNQI